MKKPQHFVFVLVEDFSHLAFACAVEPLRIANLLSGETLYRWSFASEDGQSATCSNRSVTLVHHGLDKLPVCDRLFILSGINMRQHVTRPLLNMLRREARHGTPIGALCSGAWVLAEDGFLNGMKAAIHWEFHDSFMERFPEVNLVRNVFVADERHLTASGGTATADLMLHLIERDHGATLSRSVGNQYQIDRIRNATIHQRPGPLDRLENLPAPLRSAISQMLANIEEPLKMDDLAAEIGLNVRRMERLFGAHLDTSPAQFYRRLRLEKARDLLLHTSLPTLEIAGLVGFASSSHFAMAYQRTFGARPSDDRRPRRDPAGRVSRR